MQWSDVVVSLLPEEVKLGERKNIKFDAISIKNLYRQPLVLYFLEENFSSLTLGLPTFFYLSVYGRVDFDTCYFVAQFFTFFYNLTLPKLSKK